LNIPVSINGSPFTINRGYKLGVGTGNQVGGTISQDNAPSDVALLRLSSAVPASVATPAAIASGWPAIGSVATLFGFGCTNRNGTGGGNKQFFEFTIGATTQALCPGDSGGPGVVGHFNENGAIWGVNSAFSNSDGADWFGDATVHAPPGLVAVRKVGSATESNVTVANFPGWASTPGVKAATGDFNNDGCGDILLAGPPSWTTTPFAGGNCSGGFTVQNLDGGSVSGWAANARFMLSGRFVSSMPTTDSGIALIGGSGWTTIPTGFLYFIWVTTNLGGTNIANFNSWAQAPGANALAGDFNADGLTDIALTGGQGWNTIPVAFANGDGTFTITNRTVANFPGWATTPGVKSAVGDFDGDGDADLAITGGSGFQTIPLALSNRDGTFTVTNKVVSRFPQWAGEPGVKLVAGDFDADGDADIAAAGSATWITVPFAFSNRDGTFATGNLPLANWPSWSAQAPFLLAGRMNSDARADMVALGVSTWTTQPVLFSAP
jgi:hypothetical protein